MPSVLRTFKVGIALAGMAVLQLGFIAAFSSTPVDAACCVCRDEQAVAGQHNCWFFPSNPRDNECLVVPTPTNQTSDRTSGTPGSQDILRSRCSVAPVSQNGACPTEQGRWAFQICEQVQVSAQTVAPTADRPAATAFSYGGNENANGAAVINALQGSGVQAGTAYQGTGAVSERSAEFRSLTPRLSVPIPGLTFHDAVITSDNDISVPFLAEYIVAIYKFAIGSASLLASIMVVYGGFRYLLGSTLGDVKTGKEVIENAVIGLIVLLCSYVILNTINPDLVRLQPFKLNYFNRNLSIPVAPAASGTPARTSPTTTAGGAPTAPVNGAAPGAPAAPLPPPSRRLPEPANSMTGTQISLQLLGIRDAAVGAQVLEKIKSGHFDQAEALVPRGSVAMGSDARETVIESSLNAKQYPAFLTQFIPVNVSIPGHTGTFFVTPDVLSIGTDADYLRIPMQARTAQRVANHFGMILPTKQMVEAMINAPNFTKENHVSYRPIFGRGRDDLYAYIRTNKQLQEVRNSHFAPGRGYIGGKKDIVMGTDMSRARPNSPGDSCTSRTTLRIFIYGGVNQAGGVVQAYSDVHDLTYVDYSHGVHLVANEMIVDGREGVRVTDVLNNPDTYRLISGSRIPVPTYPLSGAVCSS